MKVNRDDPLWIATASAVVAVEVVEGNKMPPDHRGGSSYPAIVAAEHADALWHERERRDADDGYPSSDDGKPSPDDDYIVRLKVK